MQIQPVASHFINGEYVEDMSGTPIDVIYPASGEIGQAPKGLQIDKKKRPGRKAGHAEDFCQANKR